MITVTSSANYVIVDMGAYYPNFTQIKRGYWKKDQIYLILQNSNHIEIEAADRHSWMLNFDGGDIGFQVASIDGVAPTSLNDLFDKLVAATL